MEIGTKLPYFELKGCDLKTHSLVDVSDKSCILILFICNHCPYVVAYLDRINKLFRRYYEEANRQSGKTGENLLRILESRLDNVVYRAGLARTRRMARQLVSHGHFTVNGVKVNVPSYRVSQYDIIDVRDNSLNTVPFQISREVAGDRPIPAWLQVVGERQRILVHQLPERAQIDVPLTEQLIVEFYSK